jgi:hypothetical protein
MAASIKLLPGATIRWQPGGRNKRKRKVGLDENHKRNDFVQRAGWVQPFHRGLEPAGVDARGRHRSHSRTSPEELPGSEAANYSDNGPQFIACDFKELIRISGMTHVRTSPHYLQSNGKIERWHKSLKSECIRPGTPLSLADAQRLVQGYVDHYNNLRLNCAIGYITPKDMLAGRQQEIHSERDRKLAAARQQRQLRRQQAV